MDAAVFQRVAARIDGYREEMIRMETDLTAIPALGPENEGEGELAKSEYIRRVLDELKPDQVQQMKAPDDRVPCGYRPNLVAQFKGKSSERTVWVMSHMDIVPPGEAKLWDSDPYKVKIEGNRMYGRGVEDNQQGLVASVYAIKALKDEGVQPECDVGLVIVADEETGSKYGIQYILQNHKDIFKTEDLIVIPDAGNSEGTMIEVAEKSILWLKFETKGKQCHGSTPEKGINAFKAASHLAVKLNDLYRIFDAKDPVFDPPISTFEPTKKEANVPNVNTIPGDDVFYFDSRILPQYKVEEVEGKVQEMVNEVQKEFGVTITTSSPQREPAAPPTPTDAPVVKSLSAAIRDVYGREAVAMGIGGGTVAAYFRRAGFNAAVWSTLDELAHQPNEYCIIDNLIGDTKVFAHMFLQT
ncbi:MAG: M20 family metallo-hydrolase [bacterium]